MDILSKLKSGLLYFDGGFGSLLQARGLKPGQIPDLWNIENPDAVKGAYLEYLRAGADVINANTFGANRLRLGHKLEEAVSAAVRLAKEAVSENGGGYVGLDLGPLGKMFEPFGDMTFKYAVELFSEVVRIGASAGADFVNIETMGDIYEAKAALLAAKESCDLPVFASVAFGDGGKLLMGSDPLSVAATLEALGADAVGINCGIGPRDALKLVSEMASYLSVPIIACPNAGRPLTVDGKTVYSVTPDEFSEAMVDIIRAGARAVGGCCGTTPAHIKALRARTVGMSPVPLSDKNRTVVCSSMATAELGKAPVLIGTVNPSRNSDAAAALLSGDTASVAVEAAMQFSCGAEIISVSADFQNVNECELLPETVTDTQLSCRAPLQLEFSSAAAAEKALRVYNGRPLLYGLCGKQAELDAVLPLAKKYGAAVIAVISDENGTPDTAAGRAEIAEKILAAAKSHGLRSSDVIFDTLISPDSSAALSAVGLIKKLGCKTALSLPSLPDEKAEAEILTRALLAGADAVISDASSDAITAAFAVFKK